MKLIMQRGTEEKRKLFGGTKTIHTLDVELEMSGKEASALTVDQPHFLFYEGVHNGREFRVTTTHLRQGRTYKREFQSDIAEIENGITAGVAEFAEFVKARTPQSDDKDTVIEF